MLTETVYEPLQQSDMQFGMERYGKQNASLRNMTHLVRYSM